MKKLLLLTVLFCFAHLPAQNKIAQKISELQDLKAHFKPISVLLPTPNAANSDVDKVVDSATLAMLNMEKNNDIVANNYSTIELKIPYQNTIIPVLLYSVNPFVEGFHADTDQAKNIQYEKGIYYRGIIKGDQHSVAAFNFFNGEFNGVISNAEYGNIVVGKLNKPNNQTDYIVYSDARMKMPNEFDCHFKSDENELPKGENSNRNTNSNRCVSFYFEVDNTLFVQNGSSTATTINWMTSVFNNVQTLYNNDGISVGLKSIYIWTTPDPYVTTPMNAFAHLNAFAANTTAFDGDTGMLVSIDQHPAGTTGLGGIAFLNTLCSNTNYAYADINFAYSTVPTYSWTIQAITHEFGHSLGSNHTHACVWNGNNTAIDNCGSYTATQPDIEGYACVTTPPTFPPAQGGTIMSYCNAVSGIGINFANGFGPQPRTLILNNVNSKTCLSTDCVSSCPNMVTQITASGISPTSMTIVWQDLSSATSWQVAVTPFSSPTDVWNTVGTRNYSTIELNPNTYYVIKIRPVCAAGIESAIRTKIVATTVANFCDNVSFTDTGGLLGNYTDRESWVRTMTPYNIGLKLRVTFSSFNLENNWDYLYIYNGPNELSPLLTANGLTGNTTPGVFNSTAADGSLTFKFVSDQGTVASGWNATITCTGTLATETTDFLDYSYYPNPTTGKVNVNSKDAITEIAVYNVQGQLLFSQKRNDLATSIDISQFAKGTYFFKLRFNDKQANFKILKM